MQVFRFDPEVAMTVRGGGSPAKLGELVGTSSLESAGVVFLDEGSRYEVGPSEFHRLIALTAGSCTVDAAGLSPFVLSVNQAFVAGPQESCSLLARESLVALAMEGSFDVWAVAVTQDIAVVPYNAAWPEWFARISNQLQPFVRDHALRIDHVGSTSVLGLSAKPIIDIDVVASSEDQVPSLIERITRAGYRWRGDLGVTGREAFSPTFDQGLPAHHLYLVVEDNKAHLDHLLLRDVLRSDARLRDEYAALKLSNVDAAQGNMDVYLAAKARFVARLLAQARRDRGLPQAEYWIPSLEENSTTES